MKRIIFLLTLVSSTIALASCGGDNGSSDTIDSITCSPETVTLSGDGGSQALSITTSHEWGATTSESWIKLDKAGGLTGQSSLVISADVNPKMEVRSGTVSFIAGTARKSVTVTQEAGSKNLEPQYSAPAGYKLVWHDEFTDNGAPSTGDEGWYYELGNNGWGNNEIQNYVDGTTHPNICFIQDGLLNIVLRKVGSEVQSIRMNTRKAWTYGYFEARLKLPKGKGTWPAFWMMPKNFTSWPGDGEIDIMEEVGYNPNYVLATIHCNKYNNGGTKIESNGKSIPTAQTDFHVYACEWTAEYLSFLFDGETILTYRNDGTGKNAWPFNAPFYLKLNLAWGGNWGGAQGIDESCLPATYQIDYVRVFQKK